MCVYIYIYSQLHFLRCFPSLISLLVSVDVKHHIYLLISQDANGKLKKKKALDTRVWHCIIVNAKYYPSAIDQGLFMKDKLMYAHSLMPTHILGMQKVYTSYSVFFFVVFKMKPVSNSLALFLYSGFSVCDLSVSGFIIHVLVLTKMCPTFCPPVKPCCQNSHQRQAPLFSTPPQ